MKNIFHSVRFFTGKGKDFAKADSFKSRCSEKCGFDVVEKQVQMIWWWEMGLETLARGCSCMKDLEYLTKEFVFTLNNICILFIEVF